MKAYKDSNNLIWFGETIYPIGSLGLSISGTSVSIWEAFPKNTIFTGDVTSLTNELNVAYTSINEFLTACGDFFVNAPTTDGGTIEITSEQVVQALGYTPANITNSYMNTGDINSIICSDITQDNWNSYSLNYQPKLVTNYEPGLTYVNPYGDAPMYAQKLHRFVSPTNCTSIRFSIEAKKPTDIVTSSVEMCILQNNGSLVANRIVALTNTLTVYDLDVTVTPDTEYHCGMFFYNVSVTQSRIILKNITLFGLNGNEFVGDWNRITIMPKHANHNINSNYDNGINAFSLNAFASVSYNTNARYITAEFASNMVTNYNAYANLGVFVNDKYYSSLQATVNGKLKRMTVDTGEGFKKVTFVCSNKSQTFGTWLRAIYVPKDSICVNVYDNRRACVLYGDSIVSGANAANQYTQSFAMLLRQNLMYNVIVEAHGYRSLYEDANSDALRKAFASKIAIANPAKMLIAIGTNDYGLDKWTASDFGIAYAALLDELHTVMPSLKIYCQTPLRRASEVINSNGNILEDYRTQISNAVSTRTSYCTLVDGKAILATTDLADGIHPNSISHAGKYFTALYNILK